MFTETFTATTNTDNYPISVSSVILADDRSKWYFVLDYKSEEDEVSRSELCTIAKGGTGSRTVIKTYDDPLVAARSPVGRNGAYFYLEGGWARLPKTDATDDELPDDERYYPNEAGKLIEITNADAIVEHGVVWQSASKLDSPDPDSDRYNGWGLHNSIPTNMVADSDNNLRFVAGYGLAYRIDNNLPTIAGSNVIADASNFNWIQWGKDLATKIASFSTTGIHVWNLIEQLAQLMRWEIGFGPHMRKVDAIQALHSSITDWGANASLFFRPRTILPAHLRNPIAASGNPTTIALNDMGIPAEASEFPQPASGERYAIIIGAEMFSYTGVTPDSQGRRLDWCPTRPERLDRGGAFG